MKRQTDEHKQIHGKRKDSSSLSENADDGSGTAGSDPSSFRRGEHVAAAVGQQESKSDSTQKRDVRSPKKRRTQGREGKIEGAQTPSRGQRRPFEGSIERVADSSISRSAYPAQRSDVIRDNLPLHQLYEQLQEQEFSALSRIALHQQAHPSFTLGLPYGGLQQSAVTSMLESSNPLYQRLNPLGFSPQPPSLLDLLSIQNAAQRPSSMQDALVGLSTLRAAPRRGLTPLETIALANQSEQRNPYGSLFSNIGPQHQSLENLMIQEQQRQLLVGRVLSGDPILSRAATAPPQLQSGPTASTAGDDLFIPALRRQFPGGFVSDQRTVILAIPEDRAKLNSQQVFLRHQIEVFRALHDDILSHTRGRNRPVMLGQCGIRCRHCGHLPVAKRSKGSTYFPSSVTGLYQATQNLSVTHLQSGLCTEMPFEMKQQFTGLMSSKVASSGVGRPYWAEAARKLGLVDTPYGIRFREDVPPGGFRDMNDTANAPAVGQREEANEGK